MLQLDKKAVSLIVSYVLLIGIGLSIAGIVFSWLKFYATFDEAESCEDGISVAILDYTFESSTLNLTVQNRGRFNVWGYMVRMHNVSDATVGIYPIGAVDIGVLAPGNVSYFGKDGLNNVCFVEIQPFIKDENNATIFCPKVSSRKIPCD